MFQSILAPPPYNVAVYDGDSGGFVVAVDLGQDETRIVAVISKLDPFILGEDEDAWEFSFEILVYALDEGAEPFTTMDRNMAARYIPAETRPSVMDVVCTSLSALIAKANPPLVYMVAKDRNLPDKALKKYDLLTGTLDGHGYTVRDEGTDVTGRRFWTMQQQSF